ncbi:hypothetical protein KIN20_027627 [Parelaphostrongylus tenuis]|uniref:Uncharacterized protein n=1 Tax=Parelaphostrongylus tenuis TaxID=148309 RepID=A0AAD5WEA6_PARTN|nr:hypothetical protein KIN20_027627 [Parelaphostrongylus tenuis]
MSAAFNIVVQSAVAVRFLKKQQWSVVLPTCGTAIMGSAVRFQSLFNGMEQMLVTANK